MVLREMLLRQANLTGNRAENALYITVKFVLDTKGMREMGVEGKFNHKEHFPVWAAVSDAIHSVRRSHLITMYHLYFPGHRLPLNAGAADSITGAKFTEESKCTSQAHLLNCFKFPPETPHSRLE